MKPITIKGEKFYYKIFEDISEWGVHIYTEFGKLKKVTRKKYWLWGEKIEKEEFICEFSLDYDIEDPQYSKEKVKSDIERPWEILERQKEILRGEII